MELNKPLVKYIDEYEGKEELREVLKKTSASSRYEMLVSCKGANGWTSAMRSAIEGDIETLKCMLLGLHSERIYEVMKFTSDDGARPLHQAAAKGYTDIIVYVLCNLSPEARFNILKVKSRNGRTPAQSAAYWNRLEALQLLLTSVTPEQQRELLAIKSNGYTVRDLITLPDLSYNYFTTKALGSVRPFFEELESKVKKLTTEHRSTNQQVNAMKSKLDAQVTALGKTRQRAQQLDQLAGTQGTLIAQQAAELGKSNQRVQELQQFVQTQGTTNSQQDGELSRANQRVQDLERLVQTQGATITQLTAALQRLTERQDEMQRETRRAQRELQEDMQRALTEMDKFNRTCFSTADTGDQEHDEQPYQII